MQLKLDGKLPEWVEANMKILNFAVENNLNTDYVFAFVMSTANEIIGRPCGNELVGMFPYPNFGDKDLYAKYATLNKYQGVGIHSKYARNYDKIKHGVEGIRECLSILNLLIEARNNYSLEYEESSVKEFFPDIDHFSKYYYPAELLKSKIIKIAGTDEYFIAKNDFTLFVPVNMKEINKLITKERKAAKLASDLEVNSKV